MYALLVCCFEYTIGCEVIAGENGGGRFRHGEKLAGARVTTFALIISRQHEGRIEWNASVAQRLAIAIVAVMGTLDFGQPQNKTDAAVSPVIQL